MSDERYEFSDAQNQVIHDLARKMQGVGIFMIALGVLALAGFVAGLLAPDLVPSLIWVFIAAYFVAVGLWSVRAARELEKVVTTEGEDIPHLMRAMGEIKKLYTLHFWLIVVYLLLVVLAILGIPGGLG